MSNLSKVKLARLFSSSTFWIAVVVIYLQSRGLQEGAVFKLLSFYAFLIVVFEYPTGVVGDYFSHRISLLSGYFATALALILLSLPGGISLYTVALSFGALGAALMSGSDNALLHSVSKDYKKDLADITAKSIVWTTVAVSLGSLVGKYNLALPTFLTAAAFFIAGLITFFVDDPSKREREGNIFAKAGEGLRFVKNDKSLLSLLGVSFVTGTFFISIKWLYNPLFGSMGFDLKWWGLLISIATLFVALGTKVFPKFGKISLPLSLIALTSTVALTGVTGLPLVALVGLFGQHFFRGFVETQLNVAMNERINSSVRASILSLNGLLIRLGSSGYIFSISYFLGAFSVGALFLATAILILLGSGVFLITKKGKVLVANTKLESL